MEDNENEEGDNEQSSLGQSSISTGVKQIIFLIVVSLYNISQRRNRGTHYSVAHPVHFIFQVKI
jgi:hypothetical protein